MTNNFEKFKEKTQKYFVKGQQNNNLKAIASNAVFWEISLLETISYCKEYWIGKFEAIDENSLKKAFDEAKKECKETISEYKSNKNKKLTTEDLLEILNKDTESNALKKYAADLNQVQKYLDSIEVPVVESKVKLTKTTQDLLYWFDRDDMIWLSKNWIAEDDKSDFKDVMTEAMSGRKLSQYSYMTMATYDAENLNRTDSAAKTVRYFLVESDSLAVDSQKKLWFDMLKFGVPIKSIIYSGGKSLHIQFYVRNDFQSDVDEVYAALKPIVSAVDSKVKNKTRLTRSPFGTYDKDGENKGNEQTVLYVNPSLSSDANPASIIRSYFESKINYKYKETVATVEPNSILSLLDRKEILDVWRNGNDYCCKQRSYSKNICNKFIIQRYSAGNFYDFLLQNLNPKLKGKNIDAKILKQYEIPFKDITFEPCLNADEINEHYVNRFCQGWLNDVLNDSNIPSKLNEKLTIYIKNLFGNSDPRTTAWTLKWMWTYLHNFEKMITAPVFWGNQGIGKTFIATAFTEAIGSSKFLKQSQLEDKNFNGWLAENACIVCEEVSAGDKKDGKKLGDQLKALITERKQSIEFKGKDIASDIYIDNCWIFTANISETIPPVFIEETDRRFTIIRNDEAQNLVELWTDEDFAEWNKGDWKKILIKWIYNLDMTNPKFSSINISRGIDNGWKQKIRDMSKNNIENQVEEWLMDHRKVEYISIASLKDDLKHNYEFEYSNAFKKELQKHGVKYGQKTQNGATCKVVYIRDYLRVSDLKSIHSIQDEEQFQIE